MPINLLAVEMDTKLQKNEKAPFTGILVPDDHYRQYMKDHQFRPILEETLLDIQNKKIKEIPAIDFLQTKTFIFGISVGAMIMGAFYLMNHG